MTRLPPLPPIRVRHPHVEQCGDLLDGSPVIVGTRLPVRTLWRWHKRGISVETICRRYPQLGPAKIFSAIAFAYDNEDVITADVDRAWGAYDQMLGKQERRPEVVVAMNDGKYVDAPHEPPVLVVARRAHCGQDPAVIGCCGGTDETCSCECNTCYPPV